MKSLKEMLEAGRASAPYTPWPPTTTTETSAAAAEAIKPVKAEQREKVFQAIRQSFQPITDEEGQDKTGLEGSSYRPRRRELELTGRIEKAGVGLTRAGRKAVTWRVVRDA